MTNADKFKHLFGIYATELWAMPARDFLEWLNADAQDMPTAERKTGKWIHIRTEADGNALYECSECHMGEVHVPIVEVKYCWYCGAKMEGET